MFRECFLFFFQEAAATNLSDAKGLPQIAKLGISWPLEIYSAAEQPGRAGRSPAKHHPGGAKRVLQKRVNESNLNPKDPVLLCAGQQMTIHFTQKHMKWRTNAIITID